ncbi:MAG TPA: cytochrome c [Methylomirabilota bacterium]|nr:cytochrome c [Methylomirabilota bacterium]
MSRARLAALAVMLALGLDACEQPALSPEAQRGRQVYQGTCTSCHSSDPGQAGPVGPELRGASRELLEAKVLRGAYPPGYRPKRSTAIMPPQPQVASDIPALAAYLK